MAVGAWEEGRQSIYCSSLVPVGEFGGLLLAAESGRGFLLQPAEHPAEIITVRKAGQFRDLLDALRGVEQVPAGRFNADSPAELLRTFSRVSQKMAQKCPQIHSTCPGQLRIRTGRGEVAADQGHRLPGHRAAARLFGHHLPRQLQQRFAENRSGRGLPAEPVLFAALFQRFPLPPELFPVRADGGGQNAAVRRKVIVRHAEVDVKLLKRFARKSREAKVARNDVHLIALQLQLRSADPQPAARGDVPVTAPERRVEVVLEPRVDLFLVSGQVDDRVGT